MSDTLVSFETAKLAKEKGFDWEIQKVYDVDETNIKNPTIYVYGEDLSEDDELYAPTQSLLQKWLREVYKIDIIVQPQVVGYYSSIFHPKIFIGIFTSYEEALEVGLQEGLKLIEYEK